jgi:hypothetical protein
VIWRDVSAQSLAAMRRPVTPSPLGVHLLLDADAAVRLGNLARNLAEGRLSLVLGVFARR